MPVCLSDVSSTSGRFVIRPNRSVTRKGMTLIYIGICAAAIAVALRFWLLGAWMVLPIAPADISPSAISSRMRRRTGSPRTSNACTS